jgi:hypothetical protein
MTSLESIFSVQTLERPFCSGRSARFAARSLAFIRNDPPNPSSIHLFTRAG